MRSPKPQQWSEAEERLLKTLINRKIGARDIAKAMGRHVKSIKTKARELGLMPLKSNRNIQK